MLPVVELGCVLEAPSVGPPRAPVMGRLLTRTLGWIYRAYTQPLALPEGNCTSNQPESPVRPTSSTFWHSGSSVTTWACKLGEARRLR